MTTRKERLRDLVRIQQQLKAFHEMRHATFVAQANAAAAEAQEIMARAEDPASLSTLFPEIYARGVGNALKRQALNTERARTEAAAVATETARTNMVEQAYREARMLDDREQAEKERLEAVQRPKPAR